MGPDGHVQNRVDLLCTDETEAIRLAEQLVDGHDVELGIWIVRSKRSSTRPRIWGERGAGMAFHCGGGGGWHDLGRDNGSHTFLALIVRVGQFIQSRLPVLRPDQPRLS